MPDISEKRYNRLMLKEKLLKNIWNEELMMEKKDYTVTYTEDAIRMMDERMILKVTLRECWQITEKVRKQSLMKKQKNW